MSDFVEYEPHAHASSSGISVEIRSAVPTDVEALAAVMAVRGGAIEDHVDRAARLIERLDVLLMAEHDGWAVGWCGVQKLPIHLQDEPEWLIAGLTVVPELRRRGIAAQLLGATAQATNLSAPAEPIFSVINARNPASIDLHEGLGFVEVGRAATFAGIEFSGGEGVLLRHP